MLLRGGNFLKEAFLPAPSFKNFGLLFTITVQKLLKGVRGKAFLLKSFPRKKIYPLFGLPERIRTAGLQSRSLTRYPAVPRAGIGRGYYITDSDFLQVENQIIAQIREISSDVKDNYLYNISTEQMK